MKGTTCVLLLLLILGNCADDNEYCDAADQHGICSSGFSSAKFVFYDVNPPEGFNLRRDVYMRMAIFAKKLNERLGNWYLVLPPWPHLYHWQSEDITEQNRLPWKLFFNVTKLASFAPVVEMSKFLQTGQKEIDQVYILQHFEDTFTTGNFNDRMKIEPCQDRHSYKRKKESNNFIGYFWGYKNITAKQVKCLTFHGHAQQLIDFIHKSKAKTIMFDHAEVVLHDRFGDKTYWDARKSMIFSDHLAEEANRYSKEELNSTNMKGTSYICVHMRRKDFARGRNKDVPSIKGASRQILEALREAEVESVFIATDATEEEKSELKSYLKSEKVFTYNPSPEGKRKYKDGGIAIIEQIICSHAKKFIGTHESTFSFRIQEEREIIGFAPETTFNRLCGDSQQDCRPPSQWRIVH